MSGRDRLVPRLLLAAATVVALAGCGRTALDWMPAPPTPMASSSLPSVW